MGCFRGLQRQAWHLGTLTCASRLDEETPTSDNCPESVSSGASRRLAARSRPPETASSAAAAPSPPVAVRRESLRRCRARVVLEAGYDRRNRGQFSPPGPAR